MNKIIFELAGCDISFIAEAPEDITLKQLLKQCNKIKPNWCSCGINNWEMENYTKEDVEIHKKEAMYDSLAVDYRLAQEEIERLNNIINELERYINEEYIYDELGMKIFDASKLQDKLQELKGSE